MPYLLDALVKFGRKVGVKLRSAIAIPGLVL
jgi:hypothetical protein